MKPNCENHPVTVSKYDGDLEQLAIDISNLRYDRLSELFGHLENKLQSDAYKYRQGARPRLAEFLTYAAIEVKSACKQFGRAWEISEPHMEIKPGKEPPPIQACLKEHTRYTSTGFMLSCICHKCDDVIPRLEDLAADQNVAIFYGEIDAAGGFQAKPLTELFN
ncbi:MAG: hypothetical protein COA65_09720 [Rhodospirillaceae bacterium]|nr:MAG: hypothetical protein COA65_09720 [Rhodospirillaceae bacterium]